MKIQNKTALIISILIPLAAGSLSSLISGNTFMYSSIQRPPLSPPPAVFPIVWTILFILMGIASYLIYISGSPSSDEALKIYGLQLFFNFFWSIIFFGLSQYLIAFIWLIILIILIIIMIMKFYKINPTAAYLLIPYLLWCLFSAYLNFGIYWLNR